MAAEESLASAGTGIPPRLLGQICAALSLRWCPAPLPSPSSSTSRRQIGQRQVPKALLREGRSNAVQPLRQKRNSGNSFVSPPLPSSANSVACSLPSLLLAARAQRRVSYAKLVGHLELSPELPAPDRQQQVLSNLSFLGEGLWLEAGERT